jgi:hypothetical protein
LHLNQLEAVQRDVAQLLEHGLNPPAAVGEVPPAPEQTPAVEGDAPAPAQIEASETPVAEK